MKRMKLAAAVLIAVCRLSPAGAAEYFVSPDGNDAHPGTSAKQAFKTIQKGAGTARAGDIVTIMPGTYTERIRPRYGGTDGKPVTYRNGGKGEAVITTSRETDGGDWLDRFAWRQDGQSHIILDGLTFRDAEAWIYLDDVRHTVIRNCVFDRCRIYHGILMKDGRYNRIEKCVFKEATPFPDNWRTETHEPANLADYVAIWYDSRFNIVEECEFNRITHVAVTIFGKTPESRPSHNIIRNNTFNEPRWKCLGIHAADHTLVENNTMTGIAAAFIQYHGALVIMRNNILHHYVKTTNTWPPDRFNGALWVRSAHDQYGAYELARHGRIYHNTFYGNDVALTYRSEKSRRTLPVYGLVFKNNIFYKNKAPLRLPRPRCPLYALQQPNYLLNNLIMGADGDTHAVAFSETGTETLFTLAQLNGKSRDIIVPEKQGAQPLPELYTGNFAADPLLTDPGKGDFTLKKGSPCIDRGAALTAASINGQGTEIEVDDPLYFCDGWGMILPDEVVIGKNSPVQLKAVDYDRNILVLEREISWQKGDPVNLKYNGKGPDLGALEYSK